MTDETDRIRVVAEEAPAEAPEAAVEAESGQTTCHEGPVSNRREPCPECGGFLVRESGCCYCVECGYSRCG